MSTLSATTAPHLYRDIARIALTRRQLQRRVRQLAKQIAADTTSGELSILAVMTGSFIFLADLVRNLPMKMRMDVISVCSYPGKAMRSLGVKDAIELPTSLAGKDLLIVDDILDSGQTLGGLIAAARLRRPSRLRTCVLLRKDRPDLPGRLGVDYVGFDVQDEFVVGYGLDYDHFYRNLPEIGVLRPQDPKALPQKVLRSTPAAGRRVKEAP